MARTSSGFHLLDMLAEVPDPRKKKGRRHPLVAMLALTVVGLLCQPNGKVHSDADVQTSIRARIVSVSIPFKNVYSFFSSPHVVVNNSGCGDTGNAYAGSNQSP